MSAIQFLCGETLTSESDWEEMDGPDSGVGIDYWYRNVETGDEVYVNEDQGEYTLSSFAE
jgi:hypothetical protein